MRALIGLLLAVPLALSGIGSAAGDGLVAGAATVFLDVPPGTPLAGYGSVQRRAWLPGSSPGDGSAFWFRPSTGVRDRLRARALVLEGGGTRLLWLALDVVGVDARLAEELAARLARGGAGRPSAVIVSASHTHSGPGAYADSEIFGVIALDRPSPAVRDRLLDAMDAAARAAAAGRQPVLLGSSSVRVRGHNPSRLGAAVDDELVVVKLVTATGRPLAALWNFAIHGTALGKGNLELSADLMGEASRRIEATLGAPALFVNGAVADASPALREERGVKVLGAALADGVLAAWRDIPARGGGAIEIARRRLELPRPRLSLRACLGPWVPVGVTIGLAPALPTATEMLAVAVGSDLAAVTIPGELQMALGLEIKAAARARFPTVMVAGLSNDYIGYLLTSAEQGRAGYTACASLYGRGAGALVRDAAVGLLDQVGSGPRPPRRARGSAGGAGPARSASPASSRAPTSSSPPCCGG